MRSAQGDLVDVVCRALEAAGDPDRAEGQQAYMKSTMPFRGITSPHLKATLRPPVSYTHLTLPTNREV